MQGNRQRSLKGILPRTALVLLAAAFSAVAPHRAAQAESDPEAWQAPPPLDWPAEDPIVESEDVGYLPGGGTITASGDYTYSLPISVPDGRSGMAPHVALRYSSRGGNGVAGKGWSVDYGGSEIARCPKTMAIEHQTAGITYGPDDALCLDGQHLIHVAGPQNMAEGAEYRTERDTFAKVVAHGDTSLGPDSFEVFEKGGDIRTYKALKANRVTEPTLNTDLESIPPVGAPETVRPVWVLSQVRDRDGNVVIYNYDVESEDEAPYAFEYRIRSIQYTGREDASGELVEETRREVQFEYSKPEERPDQLFHYENGVRHRVSRRLSWIGLSAPMPDEPDSAGGYLLLYDPAAQSSAINPRSLLATVVRMDRKGHRLWERQFEWDPGAPVDFDVHEVESLSGPNMIGKPLLLDVDNDGKDEMIYAGRLYRTSPGSNVPLDSWVQGGDMYGRPADVDGDGKMEVLRLVNGQKVFVKWNPATSTFDPTPYVFSDAQLDFVDADGDGRIDAFQVGPTDDPDVNIYGAEWFFLRNTGNGFADPIPVGGPFGMPWQLGSRAPSALDLNGDGRGELHVDYYTGDDSGPPPSECPPIPNHAWHFFALEVHGGVLTRNALHAERCPKSHVLADINGDGLKDLVHVGAASTVRFNTGAGFLPAELLPLSIITPAGPQEFLVADVNGDGRDDFVSSHEIDPADGTPLPVSFLYLSHNLGYEMVSLGQLPYDVSAYDPDPSPPGLENHSPVIQPADVNGDGLVDLVVQEIDVQAHTNRVRALVQKWHPRDVVVRVWDQDAREPRESVFYNAFPTENPSPSDCVYPSRCIRHGMVTAREHWIHRQDEPTAIRRTAYEFDDPRTDLRGRGFLGFGKVRTKDLDSYAETITLFDHATVDADGRYPFAGVPQDTWQITPILRTSTDASGGVVLPQGAPITARVRHTHVDYSVKPTNGGSTYIVVPATSETGDWEQHVELGDDGLTLLDDGSETAHRTRLSNGTYDDFGNQTASAEWTVNGQRCETNATFDNIAPDWRIGLRRTTESACNEDGLPLPEKRLSTMDYDSLGHLTQVTVEPSHPEMSRVTSFTRNIYGQVWKVVSTVAGEPTRKTYIAYDLGEHIYPRATCNGLDHCDQQLIHPAFGVPIVGQDKNGVQVHYTYDGFGRLRSVSPDDGISSEISYEMTAAGWGLATVESSSDGGESLTISDDWGRAIRSAHRGFDGDWIHERVDFNLFGQATKTYRPSTGQSPSIATATTYDTLGRVSSVEEPNGAVTTMAHSMFETETTDPLGHKSRATRDIDDRLSQTANLYKGDWVGMTYVYGPNSQVEDIVDPEGNVVHAAYDKLGRRVLLDDPDRGTTAWTYNGFGEVTSETDALGDTTVFERDVLGRVTWTCHDLDGVTQLWYDGQNGPGERGRLTYTQSPDGVSVRYGYDSKGRNKATEWQVDGQSYVVRRSWDSLGRLEGIQYPEIPNHGQLQLKYDYNAGGYASAVRDFTDPANPKTLWQIDSRNADGLITQSTGGNEVKEARGYDPLTGQITDVEAVKEGEGIAMFAVHYDRDLTGNIWQRDDHGKDIQRLETFQYDELDRLTSWSARANDHEETTKYVYDVLGNLEAVHTSSGTETHQHAGQVVNGVLRLPHALTSRSDGVHSTSYAYDERGRQILGGGREITWKPFDLPRTIHQDGRRTTFSYDAFGTRVRKVRFEGEDEIDGVDTIGGLYERRWAHGEPTKHVLTVNGADGPVAQIVYTEAANDSGHTLYLHRETLGSVGLVTDNVGGEVERTYFDPFGAKVDEYGAPMSPELGDIKLGFTGHRHDDELGLIDMRGRVYDPAQKRFLSADPHVTDPTFGQNYNRYSYVLNNPLRYTDPTGFNQAEADMKRDPEPTNADAATPAAPQEVPFFGTAKTIVVVAKSDESGHEIDPKPICQLPGQPEEPKGGVGFWASMAWGAAKQLVLSLPPVAAAKQLEHNFQVVRAAVSHASDGDWDLAGNAIAELPQQNAEAAAGMITGPVEAALAIPDAIGVALDDTVDPESRGEAGIAAVQDIATVAMAVVAVVDSARPAKGGGGSMRAAGQENLRNAGLQNVDLAGESYNSGKKALEAAGFEHKGTTSTGRQEFRNPKTGAEVYHDSGKALAPGQKPHWHIRDNAGQALNRSGRIVDRSAGSGHIPSR